MTLKNSGRLGYLLNGKKIVVDFAEEKIIICGEKGAIIFSEKISAIYALAKTILDDFLKEATPQERISFFLELTEKIR